MDDRIDQYHGISELRRRRTRPDYLLIRRYGPRCSHSAAGGGDRAGSDRIAESWAAAAAAPQMGVRRVELSTLDLQPLGDGAYEIGRATLTLAGGQRVSPRYVVVWKQEDGAWRRRVDIWNMETA